MDRTLADWMERLESGQFTDGKGECFGSGQLDLRI